MPALQSQSERMAFQAGRGRFLFVAVHVGPYLSIVPLVQELGSAHARLLLDGLSQEAKSATGCPTWSLEEAMQASGSLSQFLCDLNIQAIILGTSEGLLEDNVEVRACQVAARNGLPVFVIEDFPGNYRPCPHGRLDALFIEDGSLTDLYSSRGVAPEHLHCTGNPRYDHLRIVDREKERAKMRAALGIVRERMVLWAGQPDGLNSYLSLERLCPYLDQNEVAVLFKAHPRDQLYADGFYKEMLEDRDNFHNVTANPDPIGLCCAADLVITQFSSLGVEASYLGTPALFALFDDLGKASLRRLKGYGTLPWVERHCAFVLESCNEIEAAIESALFDENQRARVMNSFRKYYCSRPPSARVIGSIIRQTIGNGTPVRREGEHHDPIGER